MRKLSKEKRDQLILVALVTAGIVAALWFTLINLQQRHLRTLLTAKQKNERQLKDMEAAINKADQLNAQVSHLAGQLDAIENGMASGDLYSWMISTLKQFKLPYKIEIPQFSTTVEAENNMLTKFPYRQVTISITGTGYYHDLGRFVTDLENQFPYMRVQNLDVQPAPGLVSGGDVEKLSFKMDIVAPVKSSAS